MKEIVVREHALILKGLTPCERRVLILLGQGRTAQEVSETPGHYSSVRTVQFHRANAGAAVKDIIECRTGERPKRLGLVSVVFSAIRYGWIHAEDLFDPNFEFRGNAMMTQTESEVVALLLKGYSSQEIADRMREYQGREKYSKRTVDFHLADLYDKFKVGNKLELLQALLHQYRRTGLKEQPTPRFGMGTVVKALPGQAALETAAV